VFLPELCVSYRYDSVAAAVPASTFITSDFSANCGTIVFSCRCSMAKRPKCLNLLAKRKGKESEMNYDPSKCSDGLKRLRTPPKRPARKVHSFPFSAAMAFLFINPKAKLRKPPWVGDARYPAGIITSR